MHISILIRHLINSLGRIHFLLGHRMLLMELLIFTWNPSIFGYPIYMSTTRKLAALVLVLC